MATVGCLLVPSVTMVILWVPTAFHDFWNSTRVGRKERAQVFTVLTSLPSM